MKITGIIAEYDPLHAGHIYQMKAAREKTGCDYIVVVMDGAFTQRGEAALMDKYARVKMALAAGADAVLELPQVYAVRPAQIFARGGIDILAAVGADCVCFGCETDDRKLLDETAKTLLYETDELKAAIRKNLASGFAYPRALGAALDNPYIGKPNFTLAVEYIKRIAETGCDMDYCAVKRTDDYHSGGATRVRELIRSGHFDEATCGLDENVKAHYADASGIYDPSLTDALFLNSLRNPLSSASYPDDAEGLMDRINKLSRSCTSLAELIESVKCKRYTRARISRLITNAVLELPPVPDELPYIRLLGARKSSAPLLREMDIRSGGRLVSSAAELKDNPVFRAEIRAADIWGLGTRNPLYRKAGHELTQKFIMQ